MDYTERLLDHVSQRRRFKTKFIKVGGIQVANNTFVLTDWIINYQGKNMGGFLAAGLNEKIAGYTYEQLKEIKKIYG